jgi:thiol:disulfide interchange protein
MKRVLILMLAVAAAPALADDKKDGKDPKEPDKLAAFQKLDFDKAVAKAKSDKKVVMIDFYTDWCGWCKVLDQKTFSEEKVQKVLKDKMIAIKLNAEAKENLEVAKQFKIKAYPCIVFVDGEGKEVARVLGYKPPDDFLKELEKILK